MALGAKGRGGNAPLQGHRHINTFQQSRQDHPAVLHATGQRLRQMEHTPDTASGAAVACPNPYQAALPAPRILLLPVAVEQQPGI